MLVQLLKILADKLVTNCTAFQQCFSSKTRALKHFQILPSLMARVPPLPAFFQSDRLQSVWRVDPSRPEPFGARFCRSAPYLVCLSLPERIPSDPSFIAPDWSQPQFHFFCRQIGRQIRLGTPLVFLLAGPLVVPAFADEPDPCRSIFTKPASCFGVRNLVSAGMGVHGTTIPSRASGKAITPRVKTALTARGRVLWQPVSTQTDPQKDQKKEKEPSKLFRALGWGVYGASASDFISGEIAFSRGAHEGNPLQKNLAVRISFHVAVPIIFNKLTDMDRKNGHEKRALWMRIAMIVAYGAITAHNLSLGESP